MAVIYEFVTRLDKNLVIMTSDKYGEQMWAKCKARKKFTCVQYGIEFASGSLAYRPQTNGYNRMERMSVQAMEKIHG